MKTFLLAFIIFLVSATVHANSSHDFRNVNWGMTRVEVIASEPMKPLKITDRYLSYRFDLMNVNVYLLYEFVENSLLGARYVYESSDKAKASEIIGILNSKYGDNTIENDGRMIWNTNDLSVEFRKTDDYIKIVYKSKEIKKLEIRHQRILNEKEENYLLSVF